MKIIGRLGMTKYDSSSKTRWVGKGVELSSFTGSQFKELAKKNIRVAIKLFSL